MISVLIPVYKYDVSKLVTELQQQLSKAQCAYEILIFEDGSHSDINAVNSKLNELPFVTFKIHEQNLGLSGNRNSLVKAAKYDFVLLIDADMQVISPDYIQNYINYLDNTCEVVYGGMVYSKELKDDAYSLRWKYGNDSEALSVKTRMERPYKSVLSLNLLIKKSLANTILYDSTIRNYGYEDTVFAYRLKQRNSNIKHIDNPLLHQYTTTNKEFIEKTKLALENLKSISDRKMIDLKFTTLGNAYLTLKKLKCIGIISNIYQNFGSKMESQLLSSQPNLNVFKLYKLSYFCFINHNI